MKLTKERVLRAVRIAGIAVTALLLGGTGCLVCLEKTWVDPVFRAPKEAFFHGSIGTEVAPLPVMKILPDLFPEHFQPAGPAGGDWVQQFGFIPSDDPESEGLPIGFTISNYRPQSGSPSPVKFVGFGCAVCHTSMIRTSDQEKGFFVVGNGSASLNLFAWLDAFQAAMLDEERLTVPAIVDTYRAKYQKELSFTETLMIRVWLAQIRDRLKDNLPRYDAPFGAGLSVHPDQVPTGPSRTQPFRTLVRSVLQRPGSNMFVYTKLASVYRQDIQEWAQFDGTVRDLEGRSSLAALAAGATIDNMALPEIAHDIKKASDYTRTLRGPAYKDVFPDLAAAMAPERVERGRAMYMQHCDSCHGHPDPATADWVKGSRQGEVVPVEVIGTDPERVTFRYYDVLADRLYDYIPEKHPFKFKREDIRPGPAGTTKGYINDPIDAAFTRAPYLHNGTVSTLAELIHLEPRRSVFYRGANNYDPKRVGLVTPEQPDAKRPFKLDTSVRGNSNRGHDYPWPYKGPGWNQADLEDLLEYLKTI